jgi:hypothetical protein
MARRCAGLLGIESARRCVGLLESARRCVGLLGIVPARRAAGLLTVALICAAVAGMSAQTWAAEASAKPQAQGSAGAASPAAETSETESPASYEAFVKRSMPPLPPDAPRPAADPRDLEGTWFHRDVLERHIARSMYGARLPLTPEARKILDHRVASAKAGKPIANASARCLPTGHPFQLDLNFPFTILQAREEIYFVFEEFHGVWKIRMNQPHRKLDPREYMGDSVGHWDGSTLVVDTVDFKEPMWIDATGTPLSRDVHMVHRIRKIDEDGPALEIVTTIDDPTMFTTQWSMVRSYAWRPDKFIFAEYNCEEQVGGPEGLASYGVVEE